jgi:hypothetical protein
LQPISSFLPLFLNPISTEIFGPYDYPQSFPKTTAKTKEGVLYPEEEGRMGVGTWFFRGHPGNEFEFYLDPTMKKEPEVSFIREGRLIPPMRMGHPAGRLILTQKSKFQKSGLDAGSESV